MRLTIIKAPVGEPLDLASLAGLASAEGHAFVARTQTEWDSKANRFDAPGEGLFLALAATEIVGQCGLNVDPYIDDPSVGRLRHLYIAPAHRRRGIGRELVEACLGLARNRFDRVRLRTQNEAAAQFYEAIGFSRTDEPDATHTIQAI